MQYFDINVVTSRDNISVVKITSQLMTIRSSLHDRQASWELCSRGTWNQRLYPRYFHDDECGEGYPVNRVMMWMFSGF